MEEQTKQLIYLNKIITVELKHVAAKSLCVKEVALLLCSVPQVKNKRQPPPHLSLPMFSLHFSNSYRTSVWRVQNNSPKVSLKTTERDYFLLLFL